MQLENPVTITPPSITKKDGTVKTFNPITLNELDLTIMDNAKRKIVHCRVHPCPKPIILWQGDAYDAAGDYTQEMVENKVVESLGVPMASGLLELFRIGR